VTEGDSGGSEFESPLDDLFVEGARYRELSAEERARQAKDFQRQGKEAARQNRRRQRQTGNPRRWLPWVGLAVVVLAVWGLMSLGSGGGGGGSDTPTTTTTTTVESSTTTVGESPNT
jgi:hypothetical protein